MTASSKPSSKSINYPTDMKTEQALGLVGLGLMQKFSREGASGLKLVEPNEEKCDIHLLRQRLELSSLAIETGAPLSTAEVSFLMGAKPGSSKIERGGLVANKIKRNVWRLNRVSKDSSYWRN